MNFRTVEHFFIEIKAIGGTEEEVYMLHKEGYSFEEIYNLIKERLNK